MLICIDLYNSKPVKLHCRCDLVASNEKVIPSKYCFISGNDQELRTKFLLQIYNKKSVIRKYLKSSSFGVYLKNCRQIKTENNIIRYY